MSIDRRFIRVTNQWGEAFTPGENDQYIVNISGSTVKMYLSPTQIDPSTITKEFFTIGGTISQVKVDKDMYVYLTASVPDGEDTAVITDYEKMPLTDIEYLKDELETSINQIMRLSERVTKNELKLIKNKINLKLFTREWLHALAETDKYLSDSSETILSIIERIYSLEDALRKLKAGTEYHEKVEYPDIIRTFTNHANTTDLAIADINQQTLDIWNRLYSAEQWMIAHGREYNVLRSAVDTLISGGGSTEIDKGIVEALTSVIARMSVVESDLRAVSAEIDNIKNNSSVDVTELKSKVNTLNTNFAALNNAIVNLSYSYSEEEIEELFGMMIANIPRSMVETITAIKDDLIRLAKSENIVDAFESGNIVTTDNLYIIRAPSASDLIDSMESDNTSKP